MAAGREENEKNNNCAKAKKKDLLDKWVVFTLFVYEIERGRGR